MARPREVNNTKDKPQRIAKRIASSGLCSRREAEKWIEEGRVSVDGKILNSPAYVVSTNHLVLVDGIPIPETPPIRLWRYHKPRGLITTHKDPQGRPTVFERLPEKLPRVVSVGRLDFQSEGVLLLTTSGELSRKLELPNTGCKRRYRVRVHGTVEPGPLKELARGVKISGITYGPIEASLDRQQGANAWLTMSLHEGKNKEIRRICEYLGLEVNRLIRLAYGPFQLGNLSAGNISEISKKVIGEQVII